MSLDPLQTIDGAQASLRDVVTQLDATDGGRPTPNAKFDIDQLTEHLQNSIKLLGAAAGAEVQLSSEGSVADRLLPQLQQAVDAWQRRGLDGTVELPFGEYPADVAARILGVELLVHSWDYATAAGRTIDPAPELAASVLESARLIIQPERRDGDFFADEVDVPADASALTKLIAFTGRNPEWAP